MSPAELATIEGAGADFQPPSAYLFGTADPLAVVEAAARYARPLADVIEAQGLYTAFRDRDGRQRKHVNVEGWALLASMLGVHVEVAWSRPTDAGGGGYEARANAYRGPHLIGNAESMCTRDEPTWHNRQPYALRGMAQTRAISRALRGPLGMIVVLAGYDATPAEEMPAPDAVDRAPAAPRERRPAGRPRLADVRAEVLDEAHRKGIGPEGLAELARTAGVEGNATLAQLAAIRELIAAYPEPGEPGADAPAPGQQEAFDQ